jgi:hypothetical protein
VFINKSTGHQRYPAGMGNIIAVLRSVQGDRISRLKAASLDGNFFQAIEINASLFNFVNPSFSYF